MRGSMGFKGYPVSSRSQAGFLRTAATARASVIAASSDSRSPSFSPASQTVQVFRHT